jgi:hypothetical protein
VAQPARTPTLAEAIRAGVEQWMETVHTTMPGTVVSFDQARGTAAVRPAFKRRIRETGQLVDLPVLAAVPVFMPGTARTWIRFPVAAGDTVTLHFAERSLERWLALGGQVHPEDSRHHSLSDAIAVPGRLRAMTPALGAADSLEVVHGRARLEITADGRIRLGNDFAELLGLLDTILGHLVGLTVLDPVSGPLPLTAASIAQLQADVALLAKLKA